MEHLDRFRQIYSKILEDSPSNSKRTKKELEIEVRLGWFDQLSRFKSNVIYNSYRRLIEELETEEYPKETVIYTDYRYSNGIRERRVTSKTREEISEVEYIIKVPAIDAKKINYNGNEVIDSSKSQIDDSDHEYRIAFNYEVEQTKDDIDRDINSIVNVRVISRTIYTVAKYHMKIELSRVKFEKVPEVDEEDDEPKDLSETKKRMLEESARKRNRYFYEVEMEFIDHSDDKIETFLGGVEHIIKLFRGTHLIYKKSEVSNLNLRVNDLLDPERTDGRNVAKREIYVDLRNFSNARNLKRIEVVNGELVGGEHLMNVTHKIDGRRMLLIFCDNSIWLMYPPNDYFLVKRFDRNIFTALTILDGELVPMGKRKKVEKDGKMVPFTEVKYLYYIIDAVAVNGTNFSNFIDENGKSILGYTNIAELQKKNAKIRYYNFTHRRGAYQTFIDEAKDMKDGDGNHLVPQDVIDIRTKAFETIRLDNYFSVMKMMFSQMPYMDYETDGLMFTPVNYPYKTSISTEISKRRLSGKTPDICKWKPKEKLTIDFTIVKEADGIRLYCQEKMKSRQEDFKPVMFKGSDRYPFDYSTMLIPSHKLTDNELNDVIVEYAYDYEKKWLYPIGIREKSRPNRIDIAINVWEDINNPMSQEFMLDEDFILMYRFHNKIKRELFGRYTRINGPISKGGRRILLDIGSGVGGDVFKWSENYTHIIAVEPDADKYYELASRVKESKMLDRVFLINAGGEESQKIYSHVMNITEGEGVDTVSMMNSLTFFWSSEKILRKLAETIRSCLKPNGLFIWKAMDGRAVRETLRPSFPGKDTLDKIVIGDRNQMVIEAELDNDEKLTGKIDLTMIGIVGRQTEWLTRFSDLLTILNFEEIERNRADWEKLLRPESLSATKYYSYGTWRRKSNDFIQTDLSRKVRYELVNLTEIIEKGPIVKEKKEEEEDMSTALSKMVGGPALGSINNKASKGSSRGMLSGGYEKIKFNTGDSNYELVRIDTIGDGSCFYHAVLYCISPEYRNSQHDVRVKMVKNLRRSLAIRLFQLDRNNMDFDGSYLYYYETDSNMANFEQAFYNIAVVANGESSQFASANEATPTFSPQSLYYSISNPEVYADDSHRIPIANLFEIDIVIMSSLRDGFKMTTNNFVGQRYRPIIILNEVDRTHFEAVGLRDKKTGITETVFNTGPSLDRGQHPLMREIYRLSKMDEFNRDPPENPPVQIFPADILHGKFSLIGQNRHGGTLDSVFKDYKKLTLFYRLFATSLPNEYGERLPNILLHRLLKHESEIFTFDKEGFIKLYPSTYFTREGFKRAYEHCIANEYDDPIKAIEIFDKISISNAMWVEAMKIDIETARLVDRYNYLNSNDSDKTREELREEYIEDGCVNKETIALYYCYVNNDIIYQNQDATREELIANEVEFRRCLRIIAELGKRCVDYSKESTDRNFDEMKNITKSAAKKISEDIKSQKDFKDDLKGHLETFKDFLKIKSGSRQIDIRNAISDVIYSLKDIREMGMVKPKLNGKVCGGYIAKLLSLKNAGWLPENVASMKVYGKGSMTVGDYLANPEKEGDYITEEYFRIFQIAATSSLIKFIVKREIGSERGPRKIFKTYVNKYTDEYIEDLISNSKGKINTKNINSLVASAAIATSIDKLNIILKTVKGKKGDLWTKVSEIIRYYDRTGYYYGTNVESVDEIPPMYDIVSDFKTFDVKSDYAKNLSASLRRIDILKSTELKKENFIEFPNYERTLDRIKLQVTDRVSNRDHFCAILREHFVASLWWKNRNKFIEEEKQEGITYRERVDSIIAERSSDRDFNLEEEYPYEAFAVESVRMYEEPKLDPRVKEMLKDGAPLYDPELLDGM